MLAKILPRLTSQQGRRILGLYAVVTAANLLAWAWALLAFRDYPVLLGTALLAYGFGARHAVDADHIAAIDNVTRKLMQQGQRPIGVGFFFSLGHSTVVILASVVLAMAASAVPARYGVLRDVGGVLGTTVSALFLFAVALANLGILAGVHRSFRRLRRGQPSLEAELDPLFARRGVYARFFRPLFRLIGASWQMYPLGFLFGLGFDTATEIGLLGISAAEGSRGLSLWSILVFPALFTAAMSLIDTSDGILMLGAYGWAFRTPLRKLYYNLTITVVSVVVALVIGGIELLGLVGERLKLEGWFWSGIGALNGEFGGLGLLIIAIFALSWLVSLVVYRLKRYDEIELTRG